MLLSSEHQTRILMNNARHELSRFILKKKHKKVNKNPVWEKVPGATGVIDLVRG